MTTTTDLLPITEQESLDRCEAVIARGVQTFIDVGEALAEIRDGKLYRQHYDTWEEYCQDRWGIGGSRARQLIGASSVAREIETVTNVTLSNEGQARAAAKAAPADRPAVLNRAVEIAGDQPLTAKHITQAAQEISETDLPPEYDIIKRRLAAHGIALLSNMQGHHRAYVTRKEGMTGVVTFNWADVLSKLERLEAKPDPDPAGEAFRMTCPTCGEAILNGIWGDLKECGSCYHARQQQRAAPAAPTLIELDTNRMPDDLHRAGYYWHSATPPTIALNGSNWRGDAPTIEGAIESARLHKDAKGAPIATTLSLNPMEYKALSREAALFLKAGGDRRFPTTWKVLTLMTARAFEATK